MIELGVPVRGIGPPMLLVGRLSIQSYVVWLARLMEILEVEDIDALVKYPANTSLPEFYFVLWTDLCHLVIGFS